jgi:outer membrane protein OmpA-like peptidoglycan-associated protein
MAASTVTAVAGGIELGLGLSQPALNPTYQPWAVSPALALGYQHPLAKRWRLVVNGGYQRFLNDTSSSSTIHIQWPNRHADREWRLLMLDVGAQYQLSAGNTTTPYLRASLGTAFWEERLLSGGSPPATDGSGAPTELSATELTFKGAFGLHYQFHRRVGAAVEAQVTFLTGVGADFSEATNDTRSRALGTLLFKLTYRFGGESKAARSAPVQAVKTGRRLDDLHRATAAEPDRDGDGVADRIDRCPESPAEAAGWVDAYGCLVDADRDGVPDYRDQCPETSGSWPVNDSGCVTDSDSDGVPDLGDDCPDTPTGTPVDGRGCPYYPPLTDKLVFRFNYESGGSRLDAAAKRQLRALVPRIQYNADTHIRIYGYTDNVGPADANLALSQKRALRVKEFLVAEGIAADRLTAEGRGETSFAASNATAEGRAQNRRIEMIPVR